jgi:hypothetical protein
MPLKLRGGPRVLVRAAVRVRPTTARHNTTTLCPRSAPPFRGSAHTAPANVMAPSDDPTYTTRTSMDTTTVGSSFRRGGEATGARPSAHTHSSASALPGGISGRGIDAHHADAAADRWRGWASRRRRGRVGGGTNPRGFPFLLASGDAPPQAAIVPVVEPGRGRIAVAEAAP